MTLSTSRCSIRLLVVLAACGDSPAEDDVGIDAGVASFDASADARVADIREHDVGFDVGSRDAGPADGGPTISHGYRCTEVGEVRGDGVFSMTSFADRLFVGEFGYGREGQSMVSTFPGGDVPSPGLLGIGESVCALEVFEGALYANTENSGDIFRSENGSDWVRVHDGESGVIGCGLEVFNGQLYAVNFNYATDSDGRILRSADGRSFSAVWEGRSSEWGPYLREIAEHDGRLYAFGTNTRTDQGFALVSDDGEAWRLEETPSRYLRAFSWNGSLYAGATDYSSDGPAGIYRDGAPVFPVSEHYVTDIQDWDGALFAGTSAGWKDDVGTSRLLLSRDGTAWQPVCDFDELAVWSMAVHDGHLYVGTWEFGHGGKVYRVDIDPDGRGATDPMIPVDDCRGEAPMPRVMREVGYRAASYTGRRNWVIGSCYPYAYTAADDEHLPCDAMYDPDRTRSGTATFDFPAVAPGMYDVYVGGRHTTARTRSGMRVVVDGHEAFIDQHNDSLDYSNDFHGRYCLSGDIEALVDSTRDGGSDAVSYIRLVPAE